MKIEAPISAQLPQLRSLWQLAFGDEESFIDLFFENGFSPERCLCVTEEGVVIAALYWFEAECLGQAMAYLYGVATHPDHRGKGLCRMLMDETHRHLLARGYAGVVLVPQNEPLREMYRKMGYRNCTALGEFFCTDDPYPVPIHAIDSQEYARLRKAYLPEGSVLQEGSNLAFLRSYAKFYQGTDFILAAAVDGESLFGMEFLGNREAAPGILCALGFSQGTFRIPGEKKPFAMFLPLTENAMAPTYFAFAFD